MENRIAEVWDNAPVLVSNMGRKKKLLQETRALVS